MKTTLMIDDQIMLLLKQEAARQKKTMSELVEAALRMLLRSKRKTDLEFLSETNRHAEILEHVLKQVPQLKGNIVWTTPKFFMWKPCELFLNLFC